MNTMKLIPISGKISIMHTLISHYLMYCNNLSNSPFDVIVNVNKN